MYTQKKQKHIPDRPMFLCKSFDKSIKNSEQTSGNRLEQVCSLELEQHPKLQLEIHCFDALPPQLTLIGSLSLHCHLEGSVLHAMQLRVPPEHLLHTADQLPHGIGAGVGGGVGGAGVGGVGGVGGAGVGGPC